MKEYQILFDALYANPIKSDTEDAGMDAITDEFSSNTKPRLKAYYNNYYASPVKGFITSAEYDPGVKTFTRPTTKEQFQKDILSNLKEGTILVFNTSTTAYSVTNQAFAGNRYNNTYLKDLVQNEKIPSDKRVPISSVVGIATKPDSFMTVPDTFLTDKTYKSNIETIEKGIQNMIKLRDEGKILVFDDNGYGNSLLGYGFSEKFIKEDKS
jgi:hypothetical protein